MHKRKKKIKKEKEKGWNTVEVISVTDKPFFLLNRWKNDSDTRIFFWVLIKSPESSMSRSVKPESSLFESILTELMDLTLVGKWEERSTGIAEQDWERADAKAASSKAISSSLIISIGISGQQLLSFLSWTLRANSVNDSECDSIIVNDPACSWRNDRWNRPPSKASHVPWVRIL